MGKVFAAPLQWEEKGAHHIYKTERCAFAPVAVLEHSVGRAGFEVFHDNDGWRCTFWHGNRGHTVAGNLPSRDAAQSAAQHHADRIASALMANDRVEGRDAALSRRVPSHDGLGLAPGKV